MFEEDRQRVRALLRGDERAFRAFFDELFPRLFRFALVRLGDEAAAEEVVQATLCRAVPHLGGYRGEASLFTWLATICRREISRRLQRESRLAPLDLESAAARAALESLAADDEAAQRAEIASVVHSALDWLPRRYALALSWKYFEGARVVEIGERLGVTTKAAESLLGRARAAFREAFEALAEGRDPSHAPRLETT
jgi:RNA polymerase sigma-70 factor, ECF subfamily